MFATALHTSRHYILFTVMACLCVLLGGPSYAAGAASLFIAGATYYEPGASGPGWAWTDADHLELNGYTGEAIGADGDLVVTLVGQNSVVETHAPDADISMSGMEVWGNLTLCGPGSLTATGSQCGIHVAQALVVDGCTVDARADGAGVLDQTVAGIAAGGLTVRGGGRVVAAGAGTDAGLRFYGVRLIDEEFGADVASEALVVDASWLDATGADAGVACERGSLVAAHFVTPVGGAFGAASVVDVGGAVAPHVVIVPDGATAAAVPNRRQARAGADHSAGGWLLRRAHLSHTRHGLQQRATYLPPRDLVDQTIKGSLAADLLGALRAMTRLAPTNLKSGAKSSW